METIQEQARDARINSLLDDLSHINDSAEAAHKARELQRLVAGDGPVFPAVDPANIVAKGENAEGSPVSHEVQLDLRSTKRWLVLSLASSICMVTGSLGFGFLSWTQRNFWFLLVPLVVVPLVIWIEVKLERSIHRLTEEFGKWNVSRVPPGENRTVRPPQG